MGRKCKKYKTKTKLWRTDGKSRWWVSLVLIQIEGCEKCVCTNRQQSFREISLQLFSNWSEKRKHIKAAENAYLCCCLNSEFMLTSVLITVPFFTQNMWGLKLLCIQYPKHCLVAESHPTLCDLMGCSLPGSSVHGIFHARILEWIAISFSRGSFKSRVQTHIS